MPCLPGSAVQQRLAGLAQLSAGSSDQQKHGLQILSFGRRFRPSFLPSSSVHNFSLLPSPFLEFGGRTDERENESGKFSATLPPSSENTLAAFLPSFSHLLARSLTLSPVRVSSFLSKMVGWWASEGKTAAGGTLQRKSGRAGGRSLGRSLGRIEAGYSESGGGSRGIRTEGRTDAREKRAPVSRENENSGRISWNATSRTTPMLFTRFQSGTNMPHVGPLNESISFTLHSATTSLP